MEFCVDRSKQKGKRKEYSLVFSCSERSPEGNAKRDGRRFCNGVANKLRSFISLNYLCSEDLPVRFNFFFVSFLLFLLEFPDEELLNFV